METRSQASAKMAEGFKGIAIRQINAENNFVEVLMTLGGLTRDEAIRAMRTMLKVKAAKMDSVSGRINVIHGALLEPDVIRRAAEL